MNENKLCIAMAGGGTGGHLFPGISLAAAFNEINPEIEIIFLGTRTGLDAKIVPDYGYKLIYAGLERRKRGLGGLIKFGFGGLSAISTSMKTLKKYNVNALIVLGGFAAFTPALAAKLKGIPIFILEQNVLPGRVNRFMSRFAKEAYTQFEESNDKLCKAKNVITLGNPIRKFDLDNLNIPDWARNLDSSRPCLAILGGSQGALNLNKIMINSSQLILEKLNSVQIIHIAGDRDKDFVQREYSEKNLDVKVLGFVKEMDVVYKFADLFISRAGATTIAELTALGKPSILVPFPHAKDNHQFYNAKVVSEKGAAILFEEKELNEKILADKVINILDDEKKIEEMSKNSADLGKPDAAVNIANKILGQLG